jgi:hypothetical protein
MSPTPKKTPSIQSGKAAAMTQTAKERGKALAARMKPVTLADPVVFFSLFATGTCLVLALIMSLYVAGTERRDILLAKSATSEIGLLQYSDTPNTSSEALISWSKMVVGEIFTYNFNDIYQRMDASFGFFTKRGWESFAAAFLESDVFARTQSQRIFVSTLPTGLATIIAEGDEKGRYNWTVQLAAVTRIYSGTAQLENNTITLVVEKIPTRYSVTGYPFGIVKISR